jgi:hypothetical protein
MTLNQFYKLSSGEQIAVIKEQGALIGKRQSSHADMHLYQIHAFYVELAYTTIDGTLWRIGPFDHEIFLKPYLDQIDISDIVKE